MDIHKPKPWHGWREFAKELGTIVVGVLIALGAEQSVEWLHRQTEVRETREALRDEMSLNLRNIEYSQVEDRCTDGHWAGWLGWALGAPKPRFTTRGVFPPLAFSAWDVAKGGALAHMPLRERLADTHLYNDLVALQRIKDRDAELRTAFTGYRVYDRLTPAEADQIVPTIVAERTVLLYKQDAQAHLVIEAKALGVQPSRMIRTMRAESSCGGLSRRRDRCFGLSLVSDGHGDALGWSVLGQAVPAARTWRRTATSHPLVGALLVLSMSKPRALKSANAVPGLM